MESSGRPKRRRRPVVELPAEAAELEAACAADPGPEQRASMRQALAQASAGLARLREPERQVLLLCGLHGLSISEIGDALGLDPGHDSGAGPAIDDDVAGDRLSKERSQGERKKEGERAGERAGDF